MKERRRLTNLGNRVATIDTRRVKPMLTSDNRLTGSRLQARRMRIWSADPYCARCRCMVEYPHGFELDHKVALVNGGPDTDDNCQVLCFKCHGSKTGRDLRGG